MGLTRVSVCLVGSVSANSKEVRKYGSHGDSNSVTRWYHSWAYGIKKKILTAMLNL